MSHLDKLGNSDNDGCIIYSIGGNNEWQFELDLLQRTKCHIHTFDCTGAHDMKGIGNDHPDCNYKTLCGDTWSFDRIQRSYKIQRLIY